MSDTEGMADEWVHAFALRREAAKHSVVREGTPQSDMISVTSEPAMFVFHRPKSASGRTPRCLH